MTQRPHISVVIPVFDEAENVADLHRELTASLEAHGRPYEVLFVDDGSRDATLARLVEIEAADPRVRVLRLRRNFGQTAAFSAGFDHARGDVVVTSDGDLQNDPADIPRLLARLDEGYDMVCGWRRDAAGRGLQEGAVVVREPADLVGHRRAPARLRVLAQGDAARGRARHAALRRDAPVHPRHRLLDGRERGRDRRSTTARAPAAAASTASAARCACSSTSSRSSSCSRTARGRRTCSASGGSPAARWGSRSSPT